MRLLIDLSNLAYRAAYKLDLSHRGKKTNIIFGVLKSLEAIALELEPEEMVICWDGGSQRRKEIFEGYKANRKKDPEFVEDLERQLALLKGFFDVLPVVQCYEQGVEADDVMALLTRFLQHEEVGIVSTDSDLFQLCRAPGHHIVDPKKHSIVKLEMKPDQFLTYRVLVGGKDNVPGVTQVGDKTARQLISQFKTLKRILKHSKGEGGLGRMSHKEVKQVVKRNLELWDLSKPQVNELEKRSILDQYKLGRLRRCLLSDRLHELCTFFGFSSFVRRFSMFSGVFKQMIRGGTSESKDKSSPMDTKDQTGDRWTKRLRRVEGSNSKSQGKKKGRGAVCQEGEETTPSSPGSREHSQHQIKQTQDGYICRIRKVEVDGSALSGRSKGSKGATRSTDAGTKKGTLAGRSRGIDFSDPKLSPSKKVQEARAVRRSTALSVLSTLAKGDGEEWIKGQSTKRLRFVSRLIAKFESDEEYIPTKKEVKACEVLNEAYLMEEPAWFNTYPDAELAEWEIKSKSNWIEKERKDYEKRIQDKVRRSNQ